MARQALVLGVGLAALALGGCAGLWPRAAELAPALPAPAPEAVAVAVAVAPMPKPAARSAEEFDTTTPEQRAAAVAPPAASETRLGTTIAGLGDPTDPGFWVKTPLVAAPARGRAEAGNGRSVQVDLLPSGGAAGAGSQISLPALRLLELPLTDLPELVLFRQ